MDNIIFYYGLINQGSERGQLNTKKKKIKFILRTFYYYKWVKSITEFVLSHEYLSFTVFNYPILMSKIHRPYLRLNMGVEEKVKIIKDSYKFIDKFCPFKMKEILYKDGNIEIGNFYGKNNEKFNVYLSLYSFYDKEGEFNIYLKNSNKITLAKITFSVKFVDFKYKIIIGGVQGAEKDIAHKEIKKATKEMYGLFPKKVVLESLYFYEEEIGLETIKLGVGDKEHVYKAKRYKRKRSIVASYDEFWSSVNGESKDGIWVLPKSLKRKKIEDIPSKKRGQYKKRFTLLDTLKDSIGKNILEMKEGDINFK